MCGSTALFRRLTFKRSFFSRKQVLESWMHRPAFFVFTKIWQSSAYRVNR